MEKELRGAELARFSRAKGLAESHIARAVSAFNPSAPNKIAMLHKVFRHVGEAKKAMDEVDPERHFAMRFWLDTARRRTDIAVKAESFAQRNKLRDYWPAGYGD